MPKLGSNHPADPAYVFASIDGSDLIFKGPEGDLLTFAQVGDRVAANLASEARENASRKRARKDADEEVEAPEVEDELDAD